MSIRLTINGTRHELEVDPAKPLLWVLRDDLKLTGTKFGCGIAQCGACTVHVDGRAVRSCVVNVGSIAGADVLSIEGISRTRLARVQEAWIQAQVPQCGYCQPGMIMAVAAVLGDGEKHTAEEVRQRVTNICRCGSYGQAMTAIRMLTDVSNGAA